MCLFAVQQQGVLPAHEFQAVKGRFFILKSPANIVEASNWHAIDAFERLIDEISIIEIYLVGQYL